MDYTATSKNIKMSPRKIRLVVDSVKKQDLKAALVTLSMLEKRAALPLRKALDSAVANASHNFKVNKEALSIKEIVVGEGTSMKRYHFAARGRTRPYKRRTSSIRVILTDNVKSEAGNPKSKTNLNETKIQNVKTKGEEGAR